MSTQSLFHSSRALLGLAVLLCATLVVGCHEVPVAPTADEIVSLSKKPDCNQDPSHPSCGGDGEDGGTGFTVAMTGGMITPSPQEFDNFIDKTKGANATIGGSVKPFTVQFNLSATKAYAESPGNSCTFACDTSNPNLDCPAIRQSLEANLVTSGPILVGGENGSGVGTGFDKNNALNETTGNCPTFTAFGSPEGGHSMVRWRNCYVTYSDGDANDSNDAATINDGTIARTFTLEADLPGTADWENSVETFKRVDSDGDGVLKAKDDLVGLHCPLQPGDEVNTTIAPTL